MTVIVTMAGVGSRFSEAGFTEPKYKIAARGRTLFEWSIDSLAKFHDHHFIFACLGEQNCDWVFNKASEIGLENFEVVAREAVSRGQAETVFDVIHHAEANAELWIYNIDTYVRSGLEPRALGMNLGCIPVFRSDSPSMSYVHYSDDNVVDAVVEKKRVSNWASVGMYGFASADYFKHIYNKGYVQGGLRDVDSERYIAPLYSLVLQDGVVVAPKLQEADVFILGTPVELDNFKRRDDI